MRRAVRGGDAARARRACLETELLALELEHRRRASLTGAAGITGQETPGTAGSET